MNKNLPELSQGPLPPPRIIYTGWSGPEPVVLSLGANLGDRLGTMERACVALRHQAIRPVRASSLLVTRPLEGSGGGAFINVCLLVHTSLTPHQLLRRCQGIEREFGRKRVHRWGARTLDIDLIVYGQKEVHSPTLTLPHPGWKQRDFVLAGMMELGVLAGPGPPGASTRQFQHWLHDAEPCILSTYPQPLRCAA